MTITLYKLELKPMPENAIIAKPLDQDGSPWFKGENQMNTPIFEQLNTDWRDAIKSAEARTRLENKKFETEVLELLRTFKRPTVQVKEMIARLENDN